MNFLRKEKVKNQTKKLIYYSNYTLITINFVINPRNSWNFIDRISFDRSFSSLILVFCLKTFKKQPTHNKTQSPPFGYMTKKYLSFGLKNDEIMQIIQSTNLLMGAWWHHGRKWVSFGFPKRQTSRRWQPNTFMATPSFFERLQINDINFTESNMFFLSISKMIWRFFPWFVSWWMEKYWKIIYR